MSSIENVRVGDCIMLTDSRYQEEKTIPLPWEAIYQPEIGPVPLSAMLVVSIDAPFILGEELFAKSPGPVVIDTRFVSWTKLSKRFVREYCRLKDIAVPRQFQTTAGAAKRAADKLKTCPACGAAMVEVKAADKKWRLTCKPCQMQLVPMSEVRA